MFTQKIIALTFHMQDSLKQLKIMPHMLTMKRFKATLHTVMLSSLKKTTDRSQPHYFRCNQLNLKRWKINNHDNRLRT